MIEKHSEYLTAKNKDAGDLALPEDIVTFYTNLFNYQKKYYEELEQNYDITAGPDVTKINIELLPEKVNIIAYKALEEITTLLQDHHTGIQLQFMHDTLAKDTELFEKSLEFLIEHNLDGLRGIAQQLKVGLEEFIFVLVNWYKPMMVYLRKNNNKDFSKNDSEVSRCPFCGYFPDMSKIVESRDNVRILHCGLCELEWEYKRISCTVCGNETQDTLGYYSYDDNPIYRFDYCDECKSYIKTLRIEKKYEEERFDLTVENVMTYFLDASAIDMGYLRP